MNAIRTIQAGALLGVTYAAVAVAAAALLCVVGILTIATSLVARPA